VWILLHSIFSALGVIIAGGCILAIVTALIFAPFTPFIWFINVGFLAGLVELFYRKVTFTDIENLKKTSSFKQLFKNKMFRVLLLAALANLGNMISSIIFVIQWVIRHITKL
jgi:pheromone shutdown protein TraB